MATNYYFFTDTNLLLAQTTGAYGPVPKATPTDPDEYRVTSLHTASSNPTAYAACDAIVCVQRIPGSAPPLVNIILKPLVQPALNFAPVKYIIYKHILESSLIDGTNVAASTNNDLTKLAWDVQGRKNTSAGATADAPAAGLGVGLTGAGFTDLDPIDNLFYRTGVTFQLMNVKGGWSIGQFDKTLFGIDVLMDGLAFQHPLSLARKVEHKISAAALIGGETEAQIFDHWHTKEQILGFMDPCAFYGSFFRAGVLAKTSGNVPFGTKAGSTLYHEVLLSFANRNMAYLDIRNEHNFSLNYFRNYQATITATKVKIRGTAIDYYGNKWPLLTLVASNFLSNTATARNSFGLQLPVGDNLKPLVYVSQGYRDNNAGDSDSFPRELRDPERFFADFKTPVPAAGGYTVAKGGSWLKSLVLVVPNIAQQGTTTPVCCYLRLKYFKQQMGTSTAATAIQSANYLDNLFYPLDLSILIDGTANITSAVYDEEVYVNAQDEGGLAFDFVGKIGIARDLCNTSFFLLPTSVRTQVAPASAFVTLTGETSDFPSSYPEFVALKYPLERVEKTTLVFSSTEQITVADYCSDGTAEQQASFSTPDFAKFFIVTVANNTVASWNAKVAAVQGAGFRTFLGVTNVETKDNGSGVKYISFDLVLRTFVLDAINGEYRVKDIATVSGSTTDNVKVFTHARA